MNFDQFVKRIKEIREMGFVKTHRKGDTGIGKTLEDLLGISENNIAGPDFGTYELKSGRKDSSSMLTLFTKAPSPKGANKELLRVFGYKQRNRVANHHQRHMTNYVDIETDESECRIEEKELHVTVYDSRYNKSSNALGQLTCDRLRNGTERQKREKFSECIRMLF